jgi:AcrR family transcriptional regulator
MRNKVLTKEKLIEVAENIIKEEGLEACTSRNIAKHANCALGTIYNYFESRESFLEQVFIHSWESTKLKLQEMLDADQLLKDKAINMFRTVNEDVNNRSGLGRYLFGSVFKCKDMNSKANVVRTSGLEILIKLLKQSEKNSRLTDIELELSAEWIYFGVISIRKQEEDMEKFFNLVVDRFF